MKNIYYLILLFLLNTVQAQGTFNQDPSNPNLDFSMDSFTNWNLSWGLGQSSSVNTEQFQELKPSAHVIQERIGHNWDELVGGITPSGGRLKRVPDGLDRVGRLGNPSGNGYRTPAGYKMKYTIKVNQDYPILMLRIASVLDDSHKDEQNTHYKFALKTFSGESVPTQPCTGLEIFPQEKANKLSNSIPWINYRLNVGNDNMYQKWESVAIDLSSYVGQTLTLEFEHFDCYTGHHGSYTYLSAAMRRKTETIYYCEGTSKVTLDAIPDFKSYLWNTGATTQSIDINSPSDGDVYTVNLGSYNQCITTINYILKKIIVVPKFSYSCGASQKEVLFTDQSVTNVGNIVKWEWNFGDNTSTTNTTTAKDPTHIFSTPGTYNVTLTVTDENGCSETYNETVKIFGENTTSTQNYLDSNPLTFCEGELKESNIQNYLNYILQQFPGVTIDKTASHILGLITGDNGQIELFISKSGFCSFEKLFLNYIKNYKQISQFILSNQYCLNATAQTLPTTSDNGIVGTWSPSVIDTFAVGTKTYTFTPNSGECGTTYSISIEITNQLTPTFTLQNQYCLNATAQTLPTTSDNGISGTWSPSVIDTFAVGTKTYTFTPNAGECGTSYSISIEVTNPMIPIFTFQNQYCLNVIPQVLPIISDNVISGTWSPFVIDTSAVGTKTYTFTPNAGQCASTFSFVVTVTAKTTPIFNLSNSYCIGLTPQTLPSASNNGITGTWSPSVINTSLVGAATYTFTPDLGQCADSYTLAVNITDKITPVFNLDKSYCLESTPQILPLTSDNGISGTWNPSVIDTSIAGTKNYTFTPNSGQCGTSYTFSVTINQNIVLSTNLPERVLFCEEGSLLIDTGNDYPNNYYTWTWGNGNTFTGPKIIITEDGTYTLTVSNGLGCSSTFTVTASYYDKPIIKGVTVDGTKITITAEGENLEYSLDNINWQISNVFDNLQQGGLYTVYVRSNRCSPINIKVPIYKVTNFFSPNGDGYNDTWKLYPEGVLEASHVIIVDRYGKTVYEKVSNTGFEWNGTVGGRKLPTDTYWYILEIPQTQYLPAVKYSGFIVLKNRNSE